MGIGGSDGSYYEDDFDRLTGNDGNKPPEESANAQPKRQRTPSDVSITFRNAGGNAPDSSPGDGASIPLTTHRDLQTKDNPIIDPEKPDWQSLTRDENVIDPQNFQGFNTARPTSELTPISDIEDRRQQSPVQAGVHFLGESITPGAAEDLIRNPAGQKMVPNTPLGEELGMKDLPEPGQSWVDRLSMVNALKGMGHPNTDEDINLLKGFYNTVKNAFKLPGDVFGGKIDPMSQQGIEKAADLAGLMVGGPAPVAARMADGTLGSFAGVKSATANLKDLELAQKMEEVGAHPDVVWDKTGWFRGADNRWKHEISDEGSRVNPALMNMTDTSRKAGRSLDESWFEVPKEPVSLGSLFHHPDLYAAYPHLRDVKVQRTSPMDQLSGTHGWYNTRDDIMALSPNTLSSLKSTILHEIQHGIQAREGFSTGATPELFASDRWKGLRATFNEFRDGVAKQVNDKLGPNTDYEFKYALQNEHKLDHLNARATDPTLGPISRQYNAKEYERITSSLDKLDQLNIRPIYQKILKGEEISKNYATEMHKAYEAVKGETEARNVQNRLDPKVYALTPKVASESFKQRGIALDTVYGVGGKDNTYELRKWGTEKRINPKDLPDDLKDVWNNLTLGKTKREMNPSITEDVPRNQQTWSPWDPDWLKLDIH